MKSTSDFGGAAMEKILDLIYKGSTSLELRDLTTTFMEMKVIIKHFQLSLILPDMEPVVVPADHFQEMVRTTGVAVPVLEDSIPIPEDSIPVQEAQLIHLDYDGQVEDGDNQDENESLKMDFLKSGDDEGEKISEPNFPYKCEICGKGFGVSIALKKHLKKHLSKGKH